MTSTADSGTGTLRQAILDANANPGMDTIAFNIPGSGVHTIRPISTLPPVTDPVLLDGTSQPGYGGAPLIELDGSQAGGGVNGLTLLASNTTVQGLVINRFSGFGLLDYDTVNDAIQGNYIGTDATGKIAEGNGKAGVLVDDGARSNRVGTNGDGINDAAERNLISGNAADGVELYGTAADGTPTAHNLVAGNFIGTDVTGTAPLGNGGSGVFIFGGAQDNAVGGAPALANVIAFNLQKGVALYGATTTGNSIPANSIYGNSQLGIDLGADGVTLNHAGGAETGPNNLQNFPLVQTATPGRSTAVQGTLNSTANTRFTLDFYASAQPNLAHFGDGQRYLGSATTTTDANGNAAFDLTLAAATSTGEWLTATATDPGGDTSEFSAAYPLPAAPLALSATAWTPVGPTVPQFSGRVNVAAADPSDKNVMYVGGDDGGIWKTTDWLDPSPTWTPLTDYQPSLGIPEHCLVVYPGNPQIVYAAASGPGGGVLKTIDGGATWSFLANSLFNYDGLNGIVVSPTNANLVYVADGSPGNNGGLWRSTDGGLSWSNLTRALHPGAVSDVVMARDGTVLYASFTDSATPATNGIWKSTDGGSSWTQLTGSEPSGSAVGGDLIRLALAPSDPQTVCATIFTQPQKDGNLPVFWKTTDGGSTWSQLTIPSTADWRTGHALLGVDPSNPQIVYLNGYEVLYQSTDGGKSWQQISGVDSVMAHFDDTGALVVVADQGIFRWTGGTAPFAVKQGNLQLSLLWNIASDPNNPNVLFGVSQDQGSAMKYVNPTAWAYTQSGGGELGKILVDPSNSNTVYYYQTFGQYFLRSDDGGATWQQKATGLDTSGYTGYFVSEVVQYAFVLDPANPGRLLVGDNEVFETTNRADKWHAISPVLSPGFVVQRLAVAPSHDQTVFAATSDGRLFVTQDDGASGWAERDEGLPRNGVLAIQADPADARRAFVLVSGGGVWMTSDGGGTWNNLSGSNIPPSWFFSPLAVDWRPGMPALYVGTVHGVYRSLDLGQTWAHFGQGLPNTSVSDLELVPRLDLLAAATFGRGAWQIVVAGSVTHFSVSAPAGTTAGSPLAVTVRALDASGNVSTAYAGTVHFTISDGVAVLPADYTFAADDDGRHTFPVTLKTAGSHTLTVTDTVNGSVAGAAGVAVAPATATHFAVAAPASSTPGSAFDVTVTALDPFGNTDPAYTGTVRLTSDDPQATLPGPYPFTTGSGGDNGRHTFAGGVALRTAGNRTVTATDAGTASLAGAASVTVGALAATHLGLSAPAAAAAGDALDVSVAALDPYGNPDPTYRGTVRLTSDDPRATLPGPYTFGAADGGSHTFQGAVILRTPGNRSLSAADGSFLAPGAVVAVRPAAAARLAVAVPAALAAGSAFDVTVTALDPFGNVVTGYRGSVHFSSDDPQATLPADYPFTANDAGVHVFAGAVTLRTAGNRVVTAGDAANPAVTGGGSVLVRALAATRLGLTAPAGAVAGAGFDVTVAALDPFGNPDPSYRGTVQLTSTDPQAGVPAAYAFGAGDAGSHTFAGVTLRTAGNPTLTAVGTGVAAASAPVAVHSAAATHLGVAAPPAGTAGAPFGVTVTALDPFGNTDTNYQGTVRLASDDARATVPGVYRFTAGPGGDDGAHTFAGGVILRTAGARALTATDTGSAAVAGSASIAVAAAAATRLGLTAPAGTTAGSPISVGVTALDPFGNVDTNYAGTLRFGSDDGRAALPGEYTFVPADAGAHTFASVVLRSAGGPTLTVADVASPSVTVAVTVAVSPAAAAVTLTASPQPAVFGQSVTLTATVLALDPAAGTPGGTVTFLDGTMPLGTAPLDAAGRATLTVATLGRGGHTLAAAYGGDVTFGGAVAAALDQVVADQPVGDVTGQLRVSLGRPHRRRGPVRQTVTVTNVGGKGLEGPVSLVLDRLGRRVRLLNRTGLTSGGSPYLDLVPGADDLLAPGASLTATLLFPAAPGGTARFRLRVLAGVGAV